MNRRNVLGTAATFVAVGLAGCAGSLQQSIEGFFQSPVPIEIHNEGSEYYNVYLEAYEVETGRHSYEHGFAVRPGERVIPEHLAAVEQRLTVIQLPGEQGQDFADESFADEDVEGIQEVEITSDSRIVLVRLRDDGLMVDVQQRETGSE